MALHGDNLNKCNLPSLCDQFPDSVVSTIGMSLRLRYSSNESCIFFLNNYI